MRTALHPSLGGRAVVGGRSLRAGAAGADQSCVLCWMHCMVKRAKESFWLAFVNAIA